MTMVVAAALAVAALAALAAAFVFAHRRRNTRSAVSTTAPGGFICVTCGTTLPARPGHLRPMTAQERGLIVCEHPELSGAPLAELACPACGALHCFVVRGKQTHYVGTDIFAPQTRTSKCLDCGQPLARPGWPPDRDPGNPGAASLPPNIGLICSRCGGVSCVACCRNATRNRTQDGSFLCPRCFRGPVDRVYHF